MGRGGRLGEGTRWTAGDRGEGSAGDRGAPRRSSGGEDDFRCGSWQCGRGGRRRASPRTVGRHSLGPHDRLEAAHHASGTTHTPGRAPEHPPHPDPTRLPDPISSPAAPSSLPPACRRPSRRGWRRRPELLTRPHAGTRPAPRTRGCSGLIESHCTSCSSDAVDGWSRSPVGGSDVPPRPAHLVCRLLWDPHGTSWPQRFGASPRGPLTTTRQLEHRHACRTRTRPHATPLHATSRHDTSRHASPRLATPRHDTPRHTAHMRRCGI